MADLLYYMQPCPLLAAPGNCSWSSDLNFQKKNYKTESIKYKKMGAERQFGFFVCLLVLITESELVPQLQQSSAFLYS